MPLAFVAGLWGMNFDPHSSPWSMPELEWRYGYPMALGIMSAIVIAMLFYFRRKGWIKW
jgi:magnesium transporter